MKLMQISFRVMMFGFVGKGQLSEDVSAQTSNFTNFRDEVIRPLERNLHKSHVFFSSPETPWPGAIEINKNSNY